MVVKFIGWLLYFVIYSCLFVVVVLKFFSCYVVVGSQVYDKLCVCRKIWCSVGEFVGLLGWMWRLCGLVVIEDFVIVYFEDFVFGIGDQNVVIVYIGLVVVGVWCRQVMLLLLFDVVFWGEVYCWNGVVDVKLGEIGGEFFQCILIDFCGSSCLVGVSGGKKYVQKYYFCFMYSFFNIIWI